MGAVADEAPQHQVSLPSFALGKYDVTRGEYAAFVRETGYPAGDGCGSGRAIFKYGKDSKLSWENPGHAQTDRDPVMCVNWKDARAYIAWLNRKAHRGGAASANGPYRLPSEVEWEYAARAGTTTKFYWAMMILPLLSTPGSMPTPAAKTLTVFFATMARHIRWARSRRTHSAFTTWQGTFGSGPRTVTTTATRAFPPTGARTRLLRATPRRRTAMAIASELIAAARGCFRRGCCDRPPENAILPITAMTSSWQSSFSLFQVTKRNTS